MCFRYRRNTACGHPGFPHHTNEATAIALTSVKNILESFNMLIGERHASECTGLQRLDLEYRGDPGAELSAEGPALIQAILRYKCLVVLASYATKWASASGPARWRPHFTTPRAKLLRALPIFRESP